jgi:hypothetical protein
MNTLPYRGKNNRIYGFGEFFPFEISPWAYNETIAIEYFPLTKEEAKKQGYAWREQEERNYKIDIKHQDIPESIEDVEDSILSQVLECEHYGKNDHPHKCKAACTEAFKIIPDELGFYRKMNLPLPAQCPNCRHYERLSKRNPMKLWHRTCMCELKNHPHNAEKCKNEFETAYSPDRPEIVYCETCYQQEVS